MQNDKLEPEVKSTDETENGQVQIVLKNASKIYNEGKPNETRALDGIDLEIKRGEAVAVMGVSGSGKSTLLNIIGCIDALTSGEFYFDGEDMSEYEDKYFAYVRRDKIGYVLQNYGLFEDFTVYDNLKIALIIGDKLRKSEFKEKINGLLADFGLEKQAKSKVKNLSGGQKQRVAIARAVASDPEILLADEPTGALDSKTASAIMDILLAERDKGKTLIVVTHDKRVAEMADRTVFIEDGKII